MSLSAGSSVGAYEILARLGAGGMGEVYRARDTKLGRDVAIKILSDMFAADPERIARFQREAQLLAALNHPHIAAIYGVEESAGITFLILEFVDGESLADRIARADRPDVMESMRIARQIVDALEAAHDKGIVHRDLKPANIMLTADGQVKVLDFGLAKLDPVGTGASSAGDLTHSPTLTFAATQAGTILGTAAYMSPEQARGRAADKRSDVWAFGCVLFEMLTGKRAFEGEDVSDTLAAILRGEPDWSALPANTPSHVGVILRRCLQKDRKGRIPDMSVVRFMDDATSLPQSPEDPTRGTGKTALATALLRRWRVASIIFATTTLVTSIGWYLTRSVPATMARFFVAAPDPGEFVIADRFGAQPALSPDGRTLAFAARAAGGKPMLYVRPIDALVAQPLAGTDNAAYPFWSPDSRFIGYSTPAKLMKIAAAGGPPQTICAFSGSTIVGRGGAWSRNGLIVFNNGPGPLNRVSAAGGGDASAVLRLAPGQTSHNFPSFLPDGHHVTFFAVGSSRETTGVFVASLDTGEMKRLAVADSGAIYAPSARSLLFAREGTLLAQPFDAKTLTVSAEPIPIAEHMESQVIPGIVAFSISSNGLLAYGTASTSAAADLQLVWVDRQGKSLGTVVAPGNYRGIELSPDGRRLAVHRHEGMGGDIWIADLTRGSTSRFTFDASQDNSGPIWSPDGAFLAFASIRGGKWGIYRKPFNNAGEEEKLFESDGQIIPMSWAPDNQSIVYSTVDPKNSWDIWRLPLTGNRKPVALVRSPFTDLYPQVSGDGRWMAYSSTESGHMEAVVLPFSAGPGKWQVSVDGGYNPRWRHDGRELFFMSQISRGKMMAVDVISGGTSLEFGTPRALFDSDYANLTAGHPYKSYAVTGDGQRFLIPRAAALDSKNAPPSIVVVANWDAALRP